MSRSLQSSEGFKAAEAHKASGRASDTLISVWIIDHRTLFSHCLRDALVWAQPNSRVEARATLHEYLSEDANTFSVVVLSVSGHLTNARTETIRSQIAELHKSRPSVSCVIVADGDAPDQVLKALELGAKAYIPTTYPLQAFVGALELVKAGGEFIPAASLSTMAESRTQIPTTSAGEATLTSRQLAVARALWKGTPNKVIAYELNMRESTVKVHVRHIMRKLKAKNRTEIAYLASKIFDPNKRYQ